MRWIEYTLSDQFFEVKPVGKSLKAKFQDWILDDSDFVESTVRGGRREAEKHLAQLDVAYYSKSRNFLNGGVSKLSAYIEHGLVDPTTILKYIDDNSDRKDAYHFLQQLSWRDFFSKRYKESPDSLWIDLQDYKTGFDAKDYADHMPEDILLGETNVAVINELIDSLKKNGYLHNHARLYLAAYVVHWRKVKWQVGARWMVKYLIDGNLASNNYSWQWVASTGSGKPYIFNLENVKKFASGMGYNLKREDNLPIDLSYETLQKQLFPNLK